MRVFNLFWVSNLHRILAMKNMINPSLFRDYCQPNYKYFETPLILTKLIVVFRHGDRAPLRTAESAWVNKECVKCDTEKCSKQACENGLLSSKGFKQARTLGNFIMTNYASKLGPIYKIEGAHTKINRTLTTLMGVKDGMRIKNLPFSVDNSLISDNLCINLKEKLLHVFTGPKIPTYIDYDVYDNYMTSLCTDTPLNCNKFNCSSDNITRTLQTEDNEYANLMETLRNNKLLNAMSFSGFADTLRDRVVNDAAISLISAHDSTLSKLLNGLNIDFNKIPGYTSAAFIEIYKNTNNEEIVRIVFEGKIRNFGPLKQTSMRKSEFINYLNGFSSTKQVMENSCLKYNSNGNKEDQQTVVNEILTMFKMPTSVEVNKYDPNISGTSILSSKKSNINGHNNSSLLKRMIYKINGGLNNKPSQFFLSIASLLTGKYTNPQNNFKSNNSILFESKLINESNVNDKQKIDKFQDSSNKDVPKPAKHYKPKKAKLNNTKKINDDSCESTECDRKCKTHKDKCSNLPKVEKGEQIKCPDTTTASIPKENIKKKRSRTTKESKEDIISVCIPKENIMKEPNHTTKECKEDTVSVCLPKIAQGECNEKIVNPCENKKCDKEPEKPKYKLVLEKIKDSDCDESKSSFPKCATKEINFRGGEFKHLDNCSTSQPNLIFEKRRNSCDTRNDQNIAFRQTYNHPLPGVTILN